MAGFCTKCGRPLPENGICSCSMQPENMTPPQGSAPPQGYAPQQGYMPPQGYAPQQGYMPPQGSAPQQGYMPPQGYAPQQGYAPLQGYVPPQYNPVPKQDSAFVAALKNLPNLFLGYFRDPVGASRLASEKKDFLSGLIIMAMSVILTLFGTLFFALVHYSGYGYFGFGWVAPRWIGLSFLAPILAFGITIGLIYLLSLIAKANLDFRSVLAVVGVNAILPVCLLAVSMLAGMISVVVFEIFAVLMCAAWVVSFFTAVFQVFDIKMNIVNTLLLIAGLAIAFYVIVLLVTWFTTGSAHTLLRWF